MRSPSFDKTSIIESINWKDDYRIYKLSPFLPDPLMKCTNILICICTIILHTDHFKEISIILKNIFLTKTYIRNNNKSADIFRLNSTFLVKFFCLIALITYKRILFRIFARTNIGSYRRKMITREINTTRWNYIIMLNNASNQHQLLW